MKEYEPEATSRLVIINTNADLVIRDITRLLENGADITQHKLDMIREYAEQIKIQAKAIGRII